MFSNNEELSQDTVFDVLSSSRRRETLAILREEETPIELTTLAEIVAAHENGTTVEELSSQDRKRVYVSLYQTHVPKLADVGIVGHDEDTGEVWLTDMASAIEPYLSDPVQSTAWHRYYIALAVLSGVLLLAITAGVIDAISMAVLGQIVIVLFALLAVAQYAVEQRRRGPA